MEESPTAQGSARERTSAVTRPGSQIAAAPRKASRHAAASMRAKSSVSPTLTSTRLARLVTAATSTCPVAARAARQPGNRAFNHAGEDVVGTGRDCNDRHVAAPGRNRAVGAVSAQRHDRPAPRLDKPAGCLRRVAGPALEGDAERLQPQPGRAAVGSRTDYPDTIRQKKDLLHAGGFKSP